jgi:outer membrane scaffolding protein for murein synthesis (MipA/OmpV family)
VAGWVQASCLVTLSCGTALAQEQQGQSMDEVDISVERQHELENEAIAFSGTPDAGPHLRKPSIVLGAGALTGPVYNGSKVYKVLPFPYIDLRGILHDRLFVTDLVGIGVKILNKGPILAGVSISHGGGRDSRDDPHLKGLPDIKDAKRVSAYIALALNPVTLEVNVQKRAGPDTTTNVGLGASYNFAPLRQLHLSLSANTAWGDAVNNRLEFGITPAAAASATAQGNPLPAYTPGAGVIDATLSASGVYQFRKRWGVIGRVSFSDIVGRAAKDSPLNQRSTVFLSSFALGVAYTF